MRTDFVWDFLWSLSQCTYKSARSALLILPWPLTRNQVEPGSAEEQENRKYFLRLLTSSLLFWFKFWATVQITSYFSQIWRPNLCWFCSAFALSSCPTVPNSHTTCESILTAVFSQKENTSHICCNFGVSTCSSLSYLHIPPLVYSYACPG